MRWAISHRFSRRAAVLADRHYNRQTPGSPQFSPPGRLLVLLTPDADALWVTTWQAPEYSHHAWPGAWVNTLFRNEGPHLSSALIADAVAATRWRFGPPPEHGIVTFVDADEVRSTNPGYCYLAAGWERVGRTEARELHVLQLSADRIGPGEAPVGATMRLAI